MVVDIRIGDRSITDSYNHWTDSTIDWRSTEFQLIATDCKLAKLIPPWQMILTTILFLVVGYLGSIQMTILKKVSLAVIMNYKLDNIGVLNLAFQFSKCHFFLTIQKSSFKINDRERQRSLSNSHTLNFSSPLT